MIAVPAGVRVLVATKPVNFRRGADSLAALVREELQRDPFSGTIFVFRSKRADRLRILTWDGSDLVLLWKRLEQNAFRCPPSGDGVMRLSASQLAALVDAERHGLRYDFLLLLGRPKLRRCAQPMVVGASSIRSRFIDSAHCR